MKQQYLYIASIVALLITACNEDIDLKLNSSARRLVVESFITTDTMRQSVRLTFSGDYFNNQPMPAVTGAAVILRADGDELSLTEDNQHPGYYFTPDDFFGKQGVTYQLLVNNVDANNDGTPETYQAESTMPLRFPGDSIQIGFQKNWNLWKVMLFANDPANVENYYAFSVSRNDSLLTSKISDYEQADDEFFDGNDIDGVWVFGLKNNDEQYKLRKGDKVTLDVMNINETFFDYLNAIDTETSSRNPLFSGAPANVPGNISNGALGIFTTYAISSLSTINTKTKEEWLKELE
ncbi:uncharacterized protein DUF4249 [Breznakibacter xylanolyticus]|uniref:Uncharacterized protein DUF4249 n=1 Tax=Breznakibacter xylanolyticus TaxID=990 RepID=A0A2W7NH25_9BACT|nr:DUF4249 domain-containing protein [Breznakibacter xylanolyticus]PZX19150.1 uncharacterized protein DUF4249 [Breznakibacter xylanolyticus]